MVLLNSGSDSEGHLWLHLLLLELNKCSCLAELSCLGSFIFESTSMMFSVNSYSSKSSCLLFVSLLSISYVKRACCWFTSRNALSVGRPDIGMRLDGSTSLPLSILISTMSRLSELSRGCPIDVAEPPPFLSFKSSVFFLRRNLSEEDYIRTESSSARQFTMPERLSGSLNYLLSLSWFISEFFGVNVGVLVDDISLNNKDVPSYTNSILPARRHGR